MEGNEITRDSSLPAPGASMNMEIYNPKENEYIIDKDINFDEVINGKEIRDALNPFSYLSKKKLILNELIFPFIYREKDEMIMK